MIKNSITVSLSASTVEYLKRNVSSFPCLEYWFVESVNSEQMPTAISLTIEQARRFGDELTDLLAQRGFDEQYRLNSEGELLESLIDACVLK